MPARINLASTTLADTLDGRSSRVKLASVSGILPGQRLYTDGELMTVVRLDVSPWVIVQRGVGATSAMPHASGLTVYSGSAEQFYQANPTGRPPETFEVSPWINVRTGGVWFAQGDNDPVGIADRWWQLQTTTYSQGPLGVRVKTLDPTAST